MDDNKETAKTEAQKAHTIDSQHRYLSEGGGEHVGADQPNRPVVKLKEKGKRSNSNVHEHKNCGAQQTVKDTTSTPIQPRGELNTGESIAGKIWTGKDSGRLAEVVNSPDRFTAPRIVFFCAYLFRSLLGGKHVGQTIQNPKKILDEKAAHISPHKSFYPF